MSDQIVSIQKLDAWRKIAEAAPAAKYQFRNIVVGEDRNVKKDEVMVLDEQYNHLATGMSTETGDLLYIAREAILHLTTETIRQRQYIEHLERMASLLEVQNNLLEGAKR